MNQILAPAPEEARLYGAKGVPQVARVEYVGADGEQAAALVAQCNPEYYDEGPLLRLKLPGCETAYYRLGREIQGGSGFLSYLTKALPPSESSSTGGERRSVLAHAIAWVQRLLKG